MTTKLLREIQQRKPFSSLEEEALLNLVRTAEVLARNNEEFLKPHGVTGTQYNVLRILRGAGPEGATCGQIAERMVTSDPDITRLLDRLEKRGLIVRARDSRDRRAVITRITPAGARLLSALDEPVHQFVRSQLSALGRPRLHSLIALLEEIRDQQTRSRAAGNAGSASPLEPA